MAKRLFSFYHAQELAAEPEIFLAGVVDLFMNYPIEIVAKAVSPIFGLPGKFKFPPRLSEIKEFLDELLPVHESPRVYPLLPRDPAPPKFQKKPHHKTYGEFLEMAGRGECKPRPIGRFENGGST